MLFYAANVPRLLALLASALALASSCHRDGTRGTRQSEPDAAGADAAADRVTEDTALVIDAAANERVATPGAGLFDAARDNTLSDMEPAFMCGGANTDDSFMDGSTVVGSTNIYVAMRYTASVRLKVVRVEVFTGEGFPGISVSGQNGLSLWSHDAASNNPLALESAASFALATKRQWQGADLPSTIDIAAGDTKWVVWEPLSDGQSQQHSYVSKGEQVFYRNAWKTPTLWMSTPFQTGAFKFRFYCTP